MEPFMLVVRETVGRLNVKGKGPFLLLLLLTSVCMQEDGLLRNNSNIWTCKKRSDWKPMGSTRPRRMVSSRSYDICMYRTVCVHITYLVTWEEQESKRSVAEGTYPIFYFLPIHRVPCQLIVIEGLMGSMIHHVQYQYQ